MTASPFRFELEHADASSRGRSRRWSTPHGVVQTPAFMPVGNGGHRQRADARAAPGGRRADGAGEYLPSGAAAGSRSRRRIWAGCIGMMRWNGPILTDSGGFQVFSLAKLTRDWTTSKVVFRSHIDGSPFDAVAGKGGPAFRSSWGPTASCASTSARRTASSGSGWKRPSTAPRVGPRAARRPSDAADQALFGIVQGGTDPELRERSAEGLLPLDFPGYAIGGLGVGEEPPRCTRPSIPRCRCCRPIARGT